MTTTQVQLVLLGEPQRVELTKLDNGESALTGKPLARFEFSMTIHGESHHDALIDELSAAQSGDGTGITDTDGHTWRVRDYDYSRTSSSNGDLYGSAAGSGDRWGHAA